MTFLGELSH